MRLIGGEIESKKLLVDVCFTDSGRSSLRLFIRSGYAKKKFLLPNFFCSVIEDVLKEEGVSYDFYNVLDDLNIDTQSIQEKEYDVLYLINYFGKLQELEDVALEEKIVIEDNVFFDDFSNEQNYKKWFAFNSYRKVSALSDGSMIQTNLFIDKELISKQEAPFSKLKEDAKNLKYTFVHKHKASLESKYLELFKSAEKMLNAQKTIYKMSDISLYKHNSMQIIEHKRELQQRFARVKTVLGKACIEFDAKSYSFIPLLLTQRDEFRAKLREKGIFLAVHWPASTQKNRLYDAIISIPLFLNYNDETFESMLSSLKEVLE